MNFTQVVIKQKSRTHGLLRPETEGLRLGLFEVLLIHLDLMRGNSSLERLFLGVRLWHFAVVLPNN